MRIASLEDDPVQAALIYQVVEEAGHTCRMFSRGHQLLSSLREDQFDMVLLSRRPPDICGYEVLACLRRRSHRPVPVIILTDRAEEDDVVDGLLGGADDYICKPVRKAELLARIHSLHRRLRAAVPVPTALRIHGYLFDGKTRMATRHGQAVPLTPKEYELALLLFRNEGKVVSRTHIGVAVWGREMLPSSRTIDTHVSRLRGKLGLCMENGFLLQPVYTHGYRLEVLRSPGKGENKKAP